MEYRITVFNGGEPVLVLEADNFRHAERVVEALLQDARRLYSAPRVAPRYHLYVGEFDGDIAHVEIVKRRDADGE